MHHMHSVSCKDAGMACDFHVCSSDESDVIAAAQEHAKRVHGKDVPADQIKQIVKSGDQATCPG
jgi:predicted small metal-binding protein